MSSQCFFPKPRALRKTCAVSWIAQLKTRRPSLFWRTFLLLCGLIFFSVIGWLQKEENGEEMADFFAQVNLDYFQGRPDRYDREDPMFDVWQESGAFYADYVESMRQEPAVNHNQATVEY